MSALHSNAALRALRREMVRLDEARAELVNSIGDPRLQPGVAISQAAQCEREIAEIGRAHDWLESVLDGLGPAAGIAAE